MSRWQQVFIYNHLARGGRRKPTGNWKGLVKIPNMVSWMKSIREQVPPLIERLRGDVVDLERAGQALYAMAAGEEGTSTEAALRFTPQLRTPVAQLFWNAAPQGDDDAQARLVCGDVD